MMSRPLNDLMISEKDWSSAVHNLLQGLDGSFLRVGGYSRGLRPLSLGSGSTVAERADVFPEELGLGVDLVERCDAELYSDFSTKKKD